VRKIASLIVSISMVLASFIALTPATASQALQDAFVPSRASEYRPITLGVPFAPKALETRVVARADITFAAANYLALGLGNTLTVNAVLKRDGVVIAKPDVVRFSGPLTQNEGNSIIVNAEDENLTIQIDLYSKVRPDEQYVFDFELIVSDGTTDSLVNPAQYTVGLLEGLFLIDFYDPEIGIEVSTATAEVGFIGAACIRPEGLAALQVGDLVGATMTDTRGTTYTTSFFWSGNEDIGQTSREVTSNDKSGSLGLTYEVQAAVTGLTGTTKFDPVISIRKLDGNNDPTGEELVGTCVQAPTAKPVLRAGSDGVLKISAAKPSGVSEVDCYLAEADNPTVAVVHTLLENGECLFYGVKRGEYVAWITHQQNFTHSSLPIHSRRSPISEPFVLLGGNSGFVQLSANAAGSGQGSLTTESINSDAFDFASSLVGSDGKGGLLVSSVQGPQRSFSIRNLTPAGQNSQFGDSGTLVVTSTADRFQFGPNIVSYGPEQNNWALLFRAEQILGGVAEAFSSNFNYVLITGTSSQRLSESIFSTAEVASFCRSAVTGSDVNAINGHIENVVSSNDAQVILDVSCAVSVDFSNPVRQAFSQLQFHAAVGADGKLELKRALQAQPTPSEPCTNTTISSFNPAATGAELLIAAYSVRWLPAVGDCFSSSGLLNSDEVLAREFTLVTAANSAVQRPASVDAFGSFTTDPGSTEPAPCLVNQFCDVGATVAVNGSKPVLLLTQRDRFGGPALVSRVNFGVVDDITGKLPDLPQLQSVRVGSATDFGSQFFFLDQIRGLAQNDSGSLLLRRFDSEEFSQQSWVARAPARLDLATGELTTYHQVQYAVVEGSQDGFNAMVPGADGGVNFYSQRSKTSALLAQWQTTGEFSSTLAALPVNLDAANSGVVAPPSNDTGGGFVPPVVPDTEADDAALAEPSPRGWTRFIGNDQLKIYARDIVGAGKVQFFLNGREIAWVRATDGSDPKLNVRSAAGEPGDGMVRTVTAAAGRNVLEIYVDGERVARRIFTRR